MLFVLILYIRGGDLQFKVDSERQIFWEIFHGNFNLLSEFLPEIYWEEIAEEENVTLLQGALKHCWQTLL